MTDLLRKASAAGARAVAANLDSPMAVDATTADLTTATGWNTATYVDVVIYSLDANNVVIDGSQTDWTALLVGTTLTDMVIRAGTMPASGYQQGSQTVVICSPTAAWADDLVTNITSHANQDGSLKTAAVQTALSLGTGSLNGWNPLASTPSTVVYNGNRSYSLTFTGVNLTTTLSPGMRLGVTRTTSAPTQCTSLNGTSQYWSKTSPSGLTFTDDFVTSAWIKLTSYAQASIISRYNGTSGWRFSVTANGLVELLGFNAGSGNFSQLLSAQSLPLNKWVHVAAQLDMSAFTTTATTSYVMVDGQDVPATVVRAGTNPTALVQAGDLQVGASNAGFFFPGSIAQAAVFNAKVTQSTIRGYISQGLAGTETSLASAWSFNNSANDLNTTTANNLTAISAANATAADSPFGGQSNGTISATLDYAIVMQASFSTDTTVVVQVPEGCTIPTSGTVASIVYSSARMPYRFPGERGKWIIKAIWLAENSVTTSTTYVVLGQRQLTIPVGAWTVGYQAALSLNSGGAPGDFQGFVAFSTSSTSANDQELVAYQQWYNTGIAGGTVARSADKKLAAATPFYLVYKSTGVQVIAGRSPDVLYAENAYL